MLEVPQKQGIAEFETDSGNCSECAALRNNKELTVREFKTAARAYSEIETESSLQPTCYVNAVQEVFGQSATVEYTVLIKTKTPKIQRLAAARNEADLGRLGDIIENIERAVLHPSRTRADSAPDDLPRFQTGNDATEVNVPSGPLYHDKRN